MLFSTSQAGEVGLAWLPHAQWEPGWGSMHIWRQPALAYMDEGLRLPLPRMNCACRSLPCCLQCQHQMHSTHTMEGSIPAERQRRNPNQLLPPTEHGLEGTCMLSSSPHGKFDSVSLLNSVRTSILFERARFFLI